MAFQNVQRLKNGHQETLPYHFAAITFMPLFFWAIRTWPLWLSRAFSWIITAIYYPFFVNRRHNYQDNLRHILGKNVSNRKLFTATFRMCVNYGYYLIDLFRYNNRREGELSEILSHAEGYDNLKAVISDGRGAILLTAHLGNWEMGGIVLSKLGHPVNIVYFPDGHETIERERTRKRLMRGVKEIRLDPDKISPLEMLRALQKGELVAMQGDKLFHDSGVKIKFLDAETYFPRGPVLLSMLSGAPILPSFILLDKDARYRIIVEEPIYAVNTGDREQDIRENLEKVVKVFEKYIGQYYDQWYCFTRFWK